MKKETWFAEPDSDHDSDLTLDRATTPAPRSGNYVGQQRPHDSIINACCRVHGLVKGPSFEKRRSCSDFTTFCPCRAMLKRVKTGTCLAFSLPADGGSSSGVVEGHLNTGGLCNRGSAPSNRLCRVQRNAKRRGRRQHGTICSSSKVLFL